MKTRKTWREKMHNPKLPKVVAIPPAMQKTMGRGSMAIPSPLDVEAFIRTLRAGSLATPSQMREYLAAKYSADAACPMATGMFVRIAAEAAEEDAAAGKSPIAPYWRVVKDDGSLYATFPGGVARQARRLREEGHRVIPAAGKRPPRVQMGA